jgi:hypothetical protein
MGNFETTPEDKVRARIAKYAKNANREHVQKKSKKKKRAKSVWTVSRRTAELGKTPLDFKLRYYPIFRWSSVITVNWYRNY